MGKKKGKLIFSILGAAFGFMNPSTFLGAGSTAVWTGAMMGASLGSTLWSATHKPKEQQPGMASFDQYMNQISSDSMIPVVYGHRKIGGYQVYHQMSSDSKTLTKDVLLSEGEIESVYGVTANNLLIIEDRIFDIYNSLYTDATVKVANDRLTLYANGQTTEIALLEPSNLASDSSNDYSCSVSKLIQYLTGYGYSNNLKANGWIVTNAVHIDSAPKKIKNAAAVNCYNSPAAITSRGLPDCSYVCKAGSPTQTPPDNHLKTGSYRQMAYLRSTLKQSNDLQGGNPTITAVVKGVKVWVFRSGTWHFEWSNNPAWIVYDYLTNKRYGLGHWVQSWMLDLDAFREAADYCDELVSFKDTDGQIRQEKRYELDIVLTEKKNAIEHLQDMFANFNGYLVFTNAKISLKIEKPTNTSYSFSEDNIKADSVTFATATSNDTPNKYNIKYIDPLANWTAIPVIIEDTISQQERGRIISKDIELKGTIRQTQAKRTGNINKNINRLCPIAISFSTGTYAAHLEPGDVINVSWKTYFTDKPFRILEIQEQKGIYSIKAREYNESVYNDNYLAEIEVKNYSNIENALTNEIPNVSNISLSQVYYRQGDGTIVSDILVDSVLPNYQFLRRTLFYYSIDNGNSWSGFAESVNSGSTVLHNALVGQSYIIKIVTENTAGRKSNGVVSLPIVITGKDNPPSNVTGLKVYQDTNDATSLVIECNAITDVDFKALKITINGIQIPPVYGFKYIHRINSSGNYSVSVVAIDWSNNESITPTVTSILAKVEPNDISRFQALQNGESILLSWEKPLESGATVEIREGALFNSGSLVRTGYSENILQIPADTETTRRYWICAVSNSGYYSLNPQKAEVTISNLPPKNVVVQYDEVILQNGTHSNTQFGQSYYNCLTLPGKCSDYVNVKCNTIGGTTVLKLTTGATSGEYIVQRKDIGQVITANISTQFVSSILLGTGMLAKLQFRISVDGTYFEPWKDFLSTVSTFRYIDFKVVLEKTGSLSPEVNTLKETIDVDDVIKRGIATVAIGGTTVNYGYTYRTTPVVTPTAIGSGLRAELVSVGLSSFVVKVLSLSNVDVGGQVSWTSNGY